MTEEELNSMELNIFGQTKEELQEIIDKVVINEEPEVVDITDDEITSSSYSEWLEDL